MQANGTKSSKTQKKISVPGYDLDCSHQQDNFLVPENFNEIH